MFFWHLLGIKALIRIFLARSFMRCSQVMFYCYLVSSILRISLYYLHRNEKLFIYQIEVRDSLKVNLISLPPPHIKQIVALTALMSGKRYLDKGMARAGQLPSQLALEIRYAYRTKISDLQSVIQQVKYLVYLLVYSRYSL